MTGRTGTGVVKPQGFSGQVDAPSEVERLRRENEELRVRLSRLSEASLHMNEGRDLEAVLWRARAALEALVDTSPVGVIVFDAKTMEIVSVNQETRRIFGGMRGEVRTLAQLLQTLRFRRVNGSDISPEELPLKRVLRSGEAVRSEKAVIQLRDGRSVTALVNVTPVRSEDGEIVSVVATLQDIASLEEMKRMRAEIFGMVSQGLRTPLTTIRGSAATSPTSTAPKPVEPYSQSELAIDYMERRVTVAGRQAKLTATEYKLLFELSVNAGEVLTHDQLLRRVWGIEQSESTQILRAFVKSLRQKLGDDARRPTYIFTEPRVGYRMATPTDP